MQKTISIIIAIFNRKDELFELLNSLIAQTDKNFEVIIVDDGSIDLLPTVKLLRKCWKFNISKKNSGPDFLEITVLEERKMIGWFL
jgi:glycosyltransferase involved in cell wall biosynthesis